MFIVLCVAIGVLFATGAYLMLGRSMTTLILGLLLLGHGANLFVFTAGGLRRAAPPLVADGAVAPAPGYADPVPQALILTAIVIGFAVIAFAAVLVKKAYQSMGTDDLDQLENQPGGGERV